MPPIRKEHDDVHDLREKDSDSDSISDDEEDEEMICVPRLLARVPDVV